MNNHWNFNGELDIQLENLWNTMDKFQFFLEKTFFYWNQAYLINLKLE